MWLVCKNDVILNNEGTGNEECGMYQIECDLSREKQLRCQRRTDQLMRGSTQQSLVQKWQYACIRKVRTYTVCNRYLAYTLGH